MNGWAIFREAGFAHRLPRTWLPIFRHVGPIIANKTV
jgi:hypothetical protein